MRNVESYKPDKKVASRSARGFSVSKKKNKVDKFNIKHDPKVIFRATIYSLTSVILICLIVFSAYKLIRWKAESDLTNELITTIQSSSQVEEVASDEKDSVSNNSTSTIGQNDPYWNLLKQSLISVDLNDLKSTNSDVVGWIQIPGTNIDYPFVQTDNNDFYLTHSIDKYWNEAGWVFLDYRNSKNLDNRNQIIYAHGRVDGSMFGSLQNVLSKDWQSATENHVVKISSDTENSLWQVFSVYRIPKTNDYITTEFGNDHSFEEYIKLVKDRSDYNFQTNVVAGDRVLTLSTCIGLNDRVVLHAKLIKLASK